MRRLPTLGTVIVLTGYVTLHAVRLLLVSTRHRRGGAGDAHNGSVVGTQRRRISRAKRPAVAYAGYDGVGLNGGLLRHRVVVVVVVMDGVVVVPGSVPVVVTVVVVVAGRSDLGQGVAQEKPESRVAGVVRRVNGRRITPTAISASISATVVVVVDVVYHGRASISTGRMVPTMRIVPTLRMVSVLRISALCVVPCAVLSWRVGRWWPISCRIVMRSGRCVRRWCPVAVVTCKW